MTRLHQERFGVAPGCLSHYGVVGKHSSTFQRYPQVLKRARANVRSQKCSLETKAPFGWWFFHNFPWFPGKFAFLPIQIPNDTRYCSSHYSVIKFCHQAGRRAGMFSMECPLSSVKCCFPASLMFDETAGYPPSFLGNLDFVFFDPRCLMLSHLRLFKLLILVDIIQHVSLVEYSGTGLAKSYVFLT